MRLAQPNSIARTQAARSNAPGQSWYPALLTSSVLHTTLLLALALIVIRAPPQPSPLALLSEDADPRDMPQTFEFQLAPPQPAESLAEPLPEEFHALRELQLPEATLPMPSLGTVEVDDAPAGAESDSSTADMLSGALQLSAASIQDRVSQAGGKRGEVQFALSWHNVNDVDLHVINPGGDRISHMRRRLPDGGMLDVDMNVRAESQQPVENVRWIVDAPPGRYTVLVHLFRIHAPPSSLARPTRSSRFQLLAQLGSETAVREAVVSPNQQLLVFRFRYLPERLPPHRKVAMIAALDELQAKEEALARPAFETAIGVKAQRVRDQLLNNIIVQYPHTDVAIEAMQLLGGEVRK